MNRPILLICGCRAHEPYLHAAIQRSLRPEWEVIGIIGGDTTTFNPETHVLQLAAPDTYEGLPTKLHAAYAWLADNRPDAPGVFKTDDDIVFKSFDELVATVTSHAKETYWGLHRHQCRANYVNLARINARFNDTSLRPKHQTADYCFGAGYWLSAAALRIVAAAASDYRTSALEDVCTGHVLNRAGHAPAEIRLVWKEIPRIPALLNYRYPPT
jgi:hypothetical protein